MLVGWLRDQGGSYTNGFAALMVLGLIGIVTVAMLPGKKASSNIEPHHSNLKNSIFH
jgi:hypothetical protein